MATEQPSRLFPLPSLVPSTNVSYYTVPAAWLLAFAPHMYAFMRYDYLVNKYIKNTKPAPSDDKLENLKFNKTSPRTFLSTLDSNPHIPQHIKDEMIRAEGAHSNGMENLGWFAAAVVAANSAGVDVWWCNALSLWYLVNRVAFNVLYVKGAKGPVRGMAFYGSIG